MPDQRLARARASLPSGYQFLDAGKPRIAIRYLKSYVITTPEERRRSLPLSDDRSPENSTRGPVSR